MTSDQFASALRLCIFLFILAVSSIVLSLMNGAIVVDQANRETWLLTLDIVYVVATVINVIMIYMLFVAGKKDALKRSSKNMEHKWFRDTVFNDNKIMIKELFEDLRIPDGELKAIDTTSYVDKFAYKSYELSTKFLILVEVVDDSLFLELKDWKEDFQDDYVEKLAEYEEQLEDMTELTSARLNRELRSIVDKYRGTFFSLVYEYEKSLLA